MEAVDDLLFVREAVFLSKVAIFIDIITRSPNCTTTLLRWSTSHCVLTKGNADSMKPSMSTVIQTPAHRQTTDCGWLGEAGGISGFSHKLMKVNFFLQAAVQRSEAHTFKQVLNSHLDTAIEKQQLLAVAASCAKANRWPTPHHCSSARPSRILNQPYVIPAKQHRLIERSDLRADLNERRGSRCLQPCGAIRRAMT